MSAEDIRIFTSTLIRVLNEKNIRLDETSEVRLTVDIITYNRESFGMYSFRVVSTAVTLLPLTHYSSNQVDLKAWLKRSDGTTVEFTKLEEIQESSLVFEYLLESMLRRIATAVFMSDF